MHGKDVQITNFRQICGTDAQMKLLDISHCRWQCKRSRSLVIRPISSQWRVKHKEELVVLVVQMVRVLAWTARGVGLSPTQHYTFPCVVCFQRIIYYLYSVDSCWRMWQMLYHIIPRLLLLYCLCI